MNLPIRFGYLLCLAVFLSACGGKATRPTRTAKSTQTPRTVAATDTPALLQTTASATVTNTPTRAPSPLPPTPTIVPTPELLACPELTPQAEVAQPVKLLYLNENQVWLWEQASGEKTQIVPPADATAPQISEDGRFIAFLKQGQAYDTPDIPVPSIPLWLFDHQTGQARQIASFLTAQTRKFYPEAPQILLEFYWLPDGQKLPGVHWLLVQVYPVPWGVGILQPTGDLFLVNADTGTRKRILPSGAYEFYSLRPDGRQIAALDTPAWTQNGTSNWDRVQEGMLHLIDLPPGGIVRHLPVRLTKNPWLMGFPEYSPDGARVAVRIETGLAVVDTRTGSIQEIALENPCESGECDWGGGLPVTWLPDGRSFYTRTAKNDYSDERAETTLLLVRLEPVLTIETVKVIHANPWPFSFSPNGQILAYWNQPDLDTGDQNMNWVTLYLMNVQEGQPRRYAAEYVLRLISWSPDNQHFLYMYSPVGGANLVPSQLALGNVCQPPQDLPVPEGTLISEVQWLDDSRFLAWTAPTDGISNRYTASLYLYSLAEEGQLVHIDDLVRDIERPYGLQSQVIVLEK